MAKSRLLGAVTLTMGVLISLGTTQIPTFAQANPPFVTIPNSGVATGDVVTVSGSNFAPSSSVFLRLTGPLADSWSISVNTGSDGRISHAIRFNEEGSYKLEVVTNDGRPLAMLRISAARRH